MVNFDSQLLKILELARQQQVTIWKYEYHDVSEIHSLEFSIEATRTTIFKIEANSNDKLGLNITLYIKFDTEWVLMKTTDAVYVASAELYRLLRSRYRLQERQKQARIAQEIKEYLADFDI